MLPQVEKVLLLLRIDTDTHARLVFVFGGKDKIEFDPFRHGGYPGKGGDICFEFLRVINEMFLGHDPLQSQKFPGDDFHMPELYVYQVFIDAFGDAFEIAVGEDDGDHSEGHGQRGQDCPAPVSPDVPPR